MSYREFMRLINSIVNENMTIKWTIVEVRSKSKALGINIETDLDVIELIEIAKKYDVVCI